MVPVIIDEQHRAVYRQVMELLAVKTKKTPNEKLRMPFSFYKEGREHVLAISSRLAREVGIGIKTIIIRAENPWVAYASLASMIVNAGVNITS
jgi:hypothetical protein